MAQDLWKALVVQLKIKLVGDGPVRESHVYAANITIPADDKLALNAAVYQVGDSLQTSNSPVFRQGDSYCQRLREYLGAIQVPNQGQ